MQKAFFTALLALLSTYTQAQTSVTSNILANTTWTPAGSPYVVSGIIAVVESAQLTILPGTQVLFTANSGIDLIGTLYAVGTEQDSILFASNVVPAANNAWRGIRVVGTTNPLGSGNQVRMEYCKAMHAYRFTDMDLAYHGPYIFKHCHFTRNYQVNHDGGMPYVSYDDCKFVSNENALTHAQFDSYVSNSYFYDNVNGVEGFAHIDDCYFSGHTGIACSPYGATNGCTIKNNAVGVKCAFNAVNNSFTNNVVQNNGIGVEILTYFNGSETFTGNTICHNTQYNIKLGTQNNADLSNNCWCTTDAAEIGNLIYDANDGNAGLVDFTPLGSNCPQNSLGTDALSAYSGNYLVYPNPFDQEVHFKSDQPGAFFVVLYDLANRKVAEQSGSGEVTVRVDMLAQGIYMYEIRTVNGVAAAGKVLRK
jgi:hypothetical protein